MKCTCPRYLGWLVLAAALLPGPAGGWIDPAKSNVAYFGGAAMLPGGLRGLIYFITPGTEWLPDFKRLKPIGVIFTYRLDVPTTEFDQGMPGVPDRYEWFAIDYEGDFWLPKAGMYEWSLASDDGSKLYIDGKQVIDNDRQHATETVNARVKLAEGKHHIRVSYFQGPRLYVALQLAVAPPGEKFRIFDMREFRDKESPGVIATAATELNEKQVERPTLRRTEGGFRSYEMAAVDALNAKPRPRAFEYQASALHFRSENASEQYVMAFELPGSSLTATPDLGGQTQRLHVALLALVKDASGEVAGKVSLDFAPQIANERWEALRKNSMTYTQPLNLTPGKYSVETAVVDLAGKRSSTSAFQIESPRKQGVGLSSIVLVQRIEPEQKEPSFPDPLYFDGKKVVPEIAKTLPASANPYVYFVVYPDPANTEKPKITVRILFYDQVIAKQAAELPPPNAAGAIPMVIGTVARPGNWTLKVTAQQGNDSVEKSVSYTIAEP